MKKTILLALTAIVFVIAFIAVTPAQAELTPPTTPQSPNCAMNEQAYLTREQQTKIISGLQEYLVATCDNLSKIRIGLINVTILLGKYTSEYENLNSFIPPVPVYSVDTTREELQQITELQNGVIQIYDYLSTLRNGLLAFHKNKKGIHDDLQLFIPPPPVYPFDTTQLTAHATRQERRTKLSELTMGIFYANKYPLEIGDCLSNFYYGCNIAEIDTSNLDIPHPR